LRTFETHLCKRYERTFVERFVECVYMLQHVRTHVRTPRPAPPKEECAWSSRAVRAERADRILVAAAEAAC
jgi:hypothetical protein